MRRCGTCLLASGCSGVAWERPAAAFPYAGRTGDVEAGPDALDINAARCVRADYALPSESEQGRRAARRLRLDRRDRRAARARARGAVPGSAVRGGPPPARRDASPTSSSRSRGRRAVPRWSSTRSSSRSCREQMRTTLPARPRPLLRPARPADRGGGEACRDVPRRWSPGARQPLDSTVFPPHRGDRVRGQVRRRHRLGGSTEADIVLVGVSRTSKTPLSIYLGYLGYKTANVPIVEGIDAAAGAVRDRSREGRRPDDRREAPRRDPAGPRRGGWAARSARTAKLRRDLRGARAGGGGPPAARLPGDRRLRALDRGDGAARHCDWSSSARPKRRGRVKPKPPVPRWRWAAVVLAHARRPRSSSSTCC